VVGSGAARSEGTDGVNHVRIERLVAFGAVLLLAGACGDDADPARDGATSGDAGPPRDGSASGDDTPPIVTFVSPASGAELSGEAALSATATDDVGVTALEFRLDTATGTLVGAGTASGSTYSLAWNTVGASNGTHTLYAIATDAAGNRGEATVGVTVRNTSSSTGGLVAVPTFEALGLYLPRTGGDATSAAVRYRRAGTTEWRDALSLTFDPRDDELRGSIVNLSAGSAYEVEVEDRSGAVIATGTFATWSEDFPVDPAGVTILDGTRTSAIEITESGTPTAYRLTTAGADGGGIDMGFEPDGRPESCITVSASYVIIRGLTLTNCQASAIELLAGAHDVIIEGNDISGFGEGPGDPVEGDTAEIVVGETESAAVSCMGYSLSGDEKPHRIVVQGNRIRDPRYGSNPWSYGHPDGANGIGFFECGGNHVIRYNDVLGSHGHYLMDGIGGSDNFTATGFPNTDSDIYGNYVSHAYDDGIEAEGGNMQVRIWGNYITNTFIAIANGTVTRGPLYVMRNITGNHAGMYDPSIANPDREDERGLFFKLGSQDEEFVGGRAYYFHNTSLQPACPSGLGASLTCGIDSGMQNSAGSVRARNIVDANNIYTNFDRGNVAIGWQMDDESGTFANDLYIGGLDVTVVDGIEGYPIFAADVDERLVLRMHSGSGEIVAIRSYEPSRTPSEIGNFSLAPSSPGYGAAMRIPNVNDMYPSPDVGAHQSGTPSLRFGTAAWTGATAW
jgi:hypothetical protein